MFLFFFFNDTATTEIYTLSLHDALPISGLPRPARCRPQEPGKPGARAGVGRQRDVTHREPQRDARPAGDRKSTRLNSSHLVISYAVFCLKKKKKTNKQYNRVKCGQWSMT